jgi:hypothetical protein
MEKTQAQFKLLLSLETCAEEMNSEINRLKEKRRMKQSSSFLKKIK